MARSEGVAYEEDMSAKKFNEAKIVEEHFVPEQGKIEISAELREVSERLRVADFYVHKVLGRGSFGKVMLVQHKSEGTVYALKTLKKKNIIKALQIEHTQTERRY